MLREHSRKIIDAALADAMPDAAVRSALTELPRCAGKLVLVAAGKAAWQMASAAWEQLGQRIQSGIVITKYGHSRGPIGHLSVFEAGHPVPDGNSYRATRQAVELVSGLGEEDLVLFLLSGGGSALFEDPLIPPEDLQRLTGELLACGADIVQINTLRKRFSAVKGGRFGALCAPARVFTVVLSDVLGDRLDVIASGPACPDTSTCEEALRTVRSFGLTLTAEMEELLARETPKALPNVTTRITGSVRQLICSAERVCRELGYETVVLTDRLCCTARDAGSFLGSIARYHCGRGRKLAFLLGGETVVKLTGKGLGGRNQELALAAAEGIAGLPAAVFSLGSDGTDGPTDAAGGFVDGSSLARLLDAGLRPEAVLGENDSYHALEKIGGLIVTGPTGTNVNDLTVLLIEG